MELHAVKGVGKEHAKWSPVGTHSESGDCEAIRVHSCFTLHRQRLRRTEHTLSSS